MPKVTIDGNEIEVPAGTSILRAAEMADITVPYFCYHPGLSVPAKPLSSGKQKAAASAEFGKTNPWKSPSDRVTSEPTSLYRMKDFVHRAGDSLGKVGE